MKDLRVLFIEDSESDMLLILRELQKGGYTVQWECVETAGDMQAALAKTNWDLILCDYSLPSLSAPQALEIFHNSGLDIPFIIVSGTIGEEAAVSALKAGAHDFLVKNKLARLLPAIERELKDAALRRSHKPTQKALLESEERFQKAFRSSPVGLAITRTSDGIYIDINNAYSDITGFSRDELIGQTSLGLNITTLEQRQEYSVQVREQGFIHNQEMVIRHKSGEARIMLGSMEVIELNHETCVLSTAIDITKRKQTEEKLHLSDQILQRVSALVLVADSHGNIIYVSPAAKFILGYEPEELLGDNWWKLSRSEALEAQHEKEYLSRAASGQTPIATEPYERAVQDRWGNTRWISWVDTAGSDGSIIGVGHDITERKQIEDALRIAKTRNVDILESALDCIITIDHQGLILEFNPAAEKTFGYSRTEVLGREIAELIVPAALRDQHRHSLARYVVEKKTHILGKRIELTGLRADGTEFPLELTITRMAEDEPPVFTGFLRDITERKLAEESLRASEQRYRGLFEDSPISIWEEDLSLVKQRIEILHEQGVTDFQTYFTSHMEEILKCAGMVRITNINKAALQMYEAESREQMLGNLREVISPNTLAGFQDELVNIAEGKTRFHWDGKDRTLKGKSIEVNLTWSVAPGHEHDYSKVIVSTIDVTEQKRAEEKILRQIDYLTALQDIDRTIAAAFDMTPSLNTLISKAFSLLGVDAASVLLINEAVNTLKFATGDGFRTNTIRTINIKMGESYAGRAAMKQRMVKITNLQETDELSITDFLQGEDFVSYYGVPLIVTGKVVGVLEVFQRSLIKRDQEWLDFLNALAGQAAIAISNAQLFDNLQRSNTELILAYDATIEGWSSALDLRDKETEGHSQRVTEMTIELARTMGLDESELTHLRRGALLHDIGKLGVPDHILLKPGKLTDNEWEIMRKHPGFAYEMLTPIAYLRPALDIPHAHHEKWDGTGYPRGLKGEDIPLEARLFAVVDVWDALTSDRPYRLAWTKEKALEFIQEQSGKHFEPKVVEAFLTMIADK